MPNAETQFKEWQESKWFWSGFSFLALNCEQGLPTREQKGSPQGWKGRTRWKSIPAHSGMVGSFVVQNGWNRPEWGTLSRGENTRGWWDLSKPKLQILVNEVPPKSSRYQSTWWCFSPQDQALIVGLWTGTDGEVSVTCFNPFSFISRWKTSKQDRNFC